MKLSDLKSILKKVHKIGFELPNGKLVPSQFQIAKVGLQKEQLVKTDGSIENTQCVVFHLSQNPNFNHRRNLHAFVSLIENAETLIKIPDIEVRVMLSDSSETVLYSLEMAEKYFKLMAIKSDSILKTNRLTTQTTPLMDAASDPSLPGTSCC